MSVEITIENEGDLIRLMQTIPPEVLEKVQQVVKNGAVRLAERAREIVPVRTGHLLANIRAELGENIEEESAFAPIQVIADTSYASYVEWGTSRMDARPFLTPAAQEVEPEVLEEIDTVLSEMGFEKGEAIE